MTLTFSLATALVLLISFGAAVFLVRRDRLHDLDQGLLTDAPLISDSIFAPKDRRNAHGMPVSIYAALYANDGRLLQSSDGFTDPPAWATLGVEQPVRDHFLNLSNESTPLRALLTLRSDGTHLLLAVSRRPLDDDLGLLYKVVGIFFVLGSAATGLVAQTLGRRLAHDLEQVAQTARAVAAGDLRFRVREGAAFSDEMRALKDDINHMITQLDDVMTAQRTFISHAAHELRSPLSTLRGELQLALRKPREVAEYRAAVETVLADVEALILLSEDLLTLARIGESRLPEYSTVGELLADAVHQAKGAAAGRKVDFAVDVALALKDVRVCGGRRDLSRALRNLLDNAARHSPAGSTIRVLCVGPSSTLEIIVEDDGPGVPDSERAQVFAPFFRGAREQEASGAGLGLAIARQIARRHDGDVTLLQSEPAPTKSGARFALRLRRAEGTSERPS